jgi:predicted transporter
MLIEFPWCETDLAADLASVAIFVCAEPDPIGLHPVPVCCVCLSKAAGVATSNAAKAVGTGTGPSAPLSRLVASIAVLGGFG